MVVVHVLDEVKDALEKNKWAQVILGTTIVVGLALSLGCIIYQVGKTHKNDRSGKRNSEGQKKDDSSCVCVFSEKNN